MEDHGFVNVTRDIAYERRGFESSTTLSRVEMVG